MSRSSILGTALAAALACGAVTLFVGPPRTATARADDGGDDAAPAADADPLATLREQLGHYDRKDGGEGFNTIPIEQAVLRLADLGRAADLLPFATHTRFGGLIVSVLGESGGAKVAPQVVEAFGKLAATYRVEASLGFAALRTDGARAALRALADDDEVKADEASSARVRAARLRAGDPEVAGTVRAALASKDADEVARALLTAGDARAAAEFLADAARVADDGRKLAKAVDSAWPESRTTKSEDGLTTTTESVPVHLATVGEVALEAADRMVSTTLPDWVAWWYELEKAPRFGRGAEGVSRLRAFVAEDAKAAKAKAPRALDVVTAVVRALRPKAGEMGEWRLGAATFDKAWTVTYTLNGVAGTAKVDAALHVAVE